MNPSRHADPAAPGGTPGIGADPAGEAPPVDPKALRSFAAFYPFYLREHSDSRCRRMHFLGSSLALLCLALLIGTGHPGWLLAGLVAGYGCAWIGHFVFEKNRPASFKRPLYSFMGDWVMYRDMWIGRVKF